MIKGFLETEKRRGFVISELMKRSWAVDLEIIAELREICNKYDLKMFACYGTLLGSVREHGYIPWDDDIDVGMVGDDYVRFLDILSREYSDKFNILNPYTRTWYNMNFTHITNYREMSFKREHLEKWNGCPFMTGPDVFPYYYIPRDLQEEQFILDLLAKIDSVIGMNKQLHTMTADKESYNLTGKLNEAIAVTLVELQHITGYEFSSERPLDNQLEILYDQVCRITEESDADYVARYDEYTKDRSKKFPKEYFETIISVPYEGIAMPVPIGYDAILRARFGDSYIIPRREVAAHDYPYYSKQLDEEEYRVACLEQKNLPLNDSSGESFDTLSKVSKRKRILYHTGFKAMLTHCDAVTNKIKMVLEYAEEAKDAVEIWWMPDELLKTDDWALDLAIPSLIKDYEELISEYKICGGHLCSMRSDIEKIADFFDEYYGDAGDVADNFRNTDKPVIIQDYNSLTLEIETDYEKGKQSGPVEESDYDKIIIPDEWKLKLYSPDGRRKKAVLYVNSVSVMYQNRNDYPDKIRDTLKVFKEHTDDIVLIWRPCSISSETESAYGIDNIQEYRKLINESCNLPWIILDEDDNTDVAVNIADAYFGDADAVLLKCKERGIPVMIQDCSLLNSVISM